MDSPGTERTVQNGRGRPGWLLDVELKCEMDSFCVRWEYLHHGFFDALGFYETILLEVVDELLIGVAGAPPRHAEGSV